MSKDKEDRAYLWDMLAAARTVSEFIQGKTLKDYQENLMLRSAVERQVEIIGEAARKVSRSFKVENPQIPWRPIQAQRYVLAHEYGEIIAERLWLVAFDNVPKLVNLLTPLVESPSLDDGIE